ncbi:uncharacterized protein B0H64DRAFT_429951 [Chaetomium fimeti]|uniref:Uncharacterized protein n=1 Tax=Chaetomium fimeti TaxID=1854472 RepID=A0AAE0HLM0_9PEZI|nr:hypothetical protein B0H64DRAFT_429951 [Chaetomium fimeti]
MLYNIFILALTLVTLVSAHGKVIVVTGNAGGNGTALGILGGVVPNASPNLRVRLPAPSPSQPHKPPSYPTGLPSAPTNDNNNNNNKNTESDTTVFDDADLFTDGLGRTAASGPNTIAMLVHAMHLSGTTLPQITPGGNLSGTFFVITTAGAGPIHAVLDPTATGKFSAGVRLPVVEQIPGSGGGGNGSGEEGAEGNTAAEAEAGGEFVSSSRKPVLPKVAVKRRSLWARVVGAVGVWRRGVPDKVNQGFEFVFAIPANTTCTGVVASMTGVCLVKIANGNETGPFGGVVPVQMAVLRRGGGGGGGNGTFVMDGGNNGTSAAAAIAALCGRLFKE